MKHSCITKGLYVYHQLPAIIYAMGIDLNYNVIIFIKEKKERINIKQIKVEYKCCI